MVSSFLVTVGFFLLKKGGHPLPFAHTVLYSVGLTTLCWLVTALVSAPTDRARLVAFYRRVRPAGPGWAEIRRTAVMDGEVRVPGDDMGQAVLGWICGCGVIWSALFVIGNLLYGRFAFAAAYAMVLGVSGLGLLRACQRLWRDRESD